jgi:hypothetical protein
MSNWPGNVLPYATAALFGMLLGGVIQAIETTSALCKAFPTQPPAEQRRLLKLLVEKATWRAGELETTLRTPFQKLRLSNHANTTKQGKNGNERGEIENWLPESDIAGKWKWRARQESL